MIFQALSPFTPYHLLLGLSILFSFCSPVALITKQKTLYITYKIKEIKKIAHGLSMLCTITVLTTMGFHIIYSFI